MLSQGHMGAPLYHSTGQVGPRFGDSGLLMDENDAIMSYLRLTSYSNCFWHLSLCYADSGPYEYTLVVRDNNINDHVRVSFSDALTNTADSENSTLVSIAISMRRATWLFLTFCATAHPSWADSSNHSLEKICVTSNERTLSEDLRSLLRIHKRELPQPSCAHEDHHTSF